MPDRRFARSVRALSSLALATIVGCHNGPPRDPPGDPAPGVDEHALDRSVSPCEDFYQFACGGWIKATPIPEDQASWTRSFDVIEETNEGLLRGILESNAKAPVATDAYAKQLGDFYAACMDETGIERADLAPLGAELARIDAVHDIPSLSREVAHLHLQGVDVLFDMGSGQDFKDATQMIGIVEQGGLGLPDRDYYLLESDAAKAKIRAAYQDHLAKLFTLAGDKPEVAVEHATTVLMIEHALAEASMSKVDQRDPAKTYHRIDRAGLERIAPAFAWGDYLGELGFPDVNAINVAEPDFMAAVNRLIGGDGAKPPPPDVPPAPGIAPPASTTTPATPPIAPAGQPAHPPLRDVTIPQFRTYLLAHLLAAAAPRLNAAFVDEDFHWKSVLTGATKILPRWKRCVRATDAAMGDALGRPFVKETLGAEGKARALKMIGNIEERMKTSLGALPWMDPPTRTRAIEKLGLIGNKIGYPDVWRSYDGLAIDRTSYLENMLRANAFEARRQLTKIGKPVDRNDWQMSPPTVNAYYDASMNEMVFPAGILQPPFYANAAPAPVNFGGIGMVMGHELSHGFDDEGRQFDGHGNLVEWWSKTSAKEFEGRASCVAKQYDAFVPIDAIHINGRLTLGENIADLGGVKLAYYALQKELAKSPAQSSGGFTPAQQFFLGYAQAWCTNARPELLRLRLATNPHSPPRYRVIGPLSNLSEFADAFQCKAGDKMVRAPADRCEIW